MSLNQSYGGNSRDNDEVGVLRMSREEKRASTMKRTFHNHASLDNHPDAGENLKSPERGGTAARLGITPATAIVSPSSTNSSPATSPRYMSYRNTLKNRLHTPFTKETKGQGAQQPLDPVILSFDRSRDDDSASTSSSEVSSGVGSKRSLKRPAGLYAAPPPSNLPQRAQRYRLEDNHAPFRFRDAVNASYQNESWVVLVDSSDMEGSTATEPASNTRESIPRPPEDEVSSDEESHDIPHGPGLMYMKMLENRKIVPKAPTPPRRATSGGAIPNKLLSQSLQSDDDDSSSAQSGTLLDGHQGCLRLSPGGDLVVVNDKQSDPAIDLPPDHRTKAGKEHERVPTQNRCCWGSLLIVLALLLLAALLVFIIVVPSDWTFGRQDEASKGAPISPEIQSPTYPPTPVPTAAPSIGSTSTFQKTLHPTHVHVTLTPTVFSTTSHPVALVSTTAPTWDRERLDRLGEAVALLSFWGRIDLWDSSDTPQSKALYWLTDNSEWDAYTDARKIQRYALAVLYFATNGDASWINSEGWLTDENECTWYTSSVNDVCTPENRMNILHLEQNGLNGTLPSEVGLLSELTDIRLEANEISGNLPAQLSRLTNLRLLVLRENMLEGGVPSDFRALVQLQVLDLAENRLNGILPDFMSDMSQLRFLILSRNKFTGALPPLWSRLRDLRVLSVESNLLTGGVPTSYGQELSQLRELGLSSNLLDVWNGPTWRFPRLRLLALNSNELGGGIPSTLFGMDTLTSLNLANNLIGGELDPNIGNLFALEDLDLSLNQFSGEVPDGLGDLQELRSLMLQSNRFTGNLPGGLRRLRQIERLRVDGNLLSEVDGVCRGIEDTLIDFYADCAPESDLICACCTHCCDEAAICNEL